MSPCWKGKLSCPGLQISEHEKALREFQCKLCSKTLNQPLSTPCGHHFCKPCLEKLFEVHAQAALTDKSKEVLLLLAIAIRS